jgi:hypothetical protein
MRAWRLVLLFPTTLDNHSPTIRKTRFIRGLNYSTIPSWQRRTRPTGIGLNPSHPELRLALFVTQNPDPYVALSKIVEEVIRKPFQVTTPKTAGVEVTCLRVGAHLRYPSGKFIIEIIRKSTETSR